MKQIIANLFLLLCVAGFSQADQGIQSVQQALKDQGFYYGNVTGEKNADTSAAIRRYQIRTGLSVTGELDPDTLRSLNNVSKPASSASPEKYAAAGSHDVVPENSPQPNRNVQPLSSGESERRPDMSATPAGEVNRLPQPRVNRRVLIAAAQYRLISRGYDQGRVDGNYGRRTAFAVRVFQVESGLPPTGMLDRATLNALGFSETNMAYLNPVPRQNERWIPVTKFRHGRWKVKWRKYSEPARDNFEQNSPDRNGHE